MSLRVCPWGTSTSASTTFSSHPPIMHFAIGPEAQKSLRNSALGQRLLSVAHVASGDTVER